jgi:glyoxylase-like metal-dependent hydrolase (beta-lactamase superfamily II)
MKRDRRLKSENEVEPVILTNGVESCDRAKGEMESRNQSQIVRVPLGRANAYFVISGAQALLIDTGIRRNEQKIVQTLGTLGLSPSDIRLIILTHTHYDHCGSLKALKDITGARIVVHHNEATCLKEGYGGFPKGNTRLTKAISLIGRTMGKRIGGYEPVSPDIIISERFGLEEYGIEGYLLPTPGHTAGSMSAIIHDRHAIVGDTLFNAFRKNVFPPFADDRKELLRSCRKLYDTGCTYFYPGHGNPIGRDKLRRSLGTGKK